MHTPQNQRNGGSPHGHVFHEESYQISRHLLDGHKSWLGQWVEGAKLAKGVATMPGVPKRDRYGKAIALMTLPLRRGLQDAFIDLKNVQRNIQEQTGLNELPEFMDAYMAVELYRGRTGQRRLEFREQFREPLAQAMSAEGVTVEEIDAYLYLRHARERNAQIAKINPQEFPDGGSGITNQEALTGVPASETDNAILRMGLNNIPKEKRAALDRVAQHIDRINEFARQQMVRYGLESQMTIDNFTQTYQHYVPLKGIDFDAERIEAHPAEISQPGQVGNNFSVRGSESKRALGRGSLAIDIVANTLAQAEGTIVRGEKNKAGIALMNLVMHTPDPEYWLVRVNEKDPTTVTLPDGTKKVIPGKPKKKTIVTTQAGDEVREEVDGNWGDPERGDSPRSRQVIFVKIGGREFGIEMADRNLYRAFKNQGPDALTSVLGPLNFINRWQSAINTSYSPEFMVSNWIRDMETAAVTLSEQQLLSIRNQTLKDALSGRAIRGMIDDYKGNNSTWGNYAREFRLNGGQITFVNAHDVAEEVRALQQQVKDLNSGGPKAMTLSALKKGLGFIERQNTRVENGIRLAAYKNLREQGVSAPRAAHLALNLTVNFHRKGAWGKYLNALYLFFNASVQGNYRLLQAAYYSSNVRRKLYMLVGLGFALDMLNSVIAPDDDDEANSWDKVTDWEKETNVMLMVPGAVQRALGLDPGASIKFPIGYGLNVPYNFGRYLSAMGRRALTTQFDIDMGPGMRPSKAMGDMAMQLFNTFNFVGGSESIQNFLMPTVADPWIDILDNRDFADRPIAPDAIPFGIQTPDSQRYWKSTPDIYVEVAKFLNDVSGGDPVEPGMMDVSPEHLQLGVEWLTGSVGRLVEDTGVSLGGIMSGEMPEAQDVPFIRRVYRSKSEFVDKGIFYERLDAIRTLEKKVDDFPKLGLNKEVSRIRREHRRLLSLSPMFESTRKQLQNIAKLKARIEATGGASKEARLDQLARREKQLLDQANRAFNRSDADEEM